VPTKSGTSKYKQQAKTKLIAPQPAHAPIHI